MNNTFHFNHMVRTLRQFFQEKKGFIEVPAQSRVSILAACEQPKSITQYTIGGQTYPLPQTGQMWLEYELLKHPKAPGFFCVTTSYRDEPVIIAGRHERIFPMFEFESAGNFDDLKQLEEELLLHLGFEMPISIDYMLAAQRYETQTIEASHELALENELGSCISLEIFPEYTNPFWNMKHIGNSLYNKIDILLHGMETIGSAERETDVELMRDRFFTIEDGQYADLLFTKFGRQRVLSELDHYLSLPMITRFGGGIGLTRLARAMELSNLFATDYPYQTQQPTVRHASYS